MAVVGCSLLWGQRGEGHAGTELHHPLARVLPWQLLLSSADQGPQHSSEEPVPKPPQHHGAGTGVWGSSEHLTILEQL